MTVKLNDISFDKVTELRADRIARRTEVRYNTQGDLLIDLVNRKYEAEIVFALLTEQELKTLREVTGGIFVKAQFPAPEGDVCGDFYVAEEPAPTVTQVGSVTMYGGVKLRLIQK